MRTATVIFALLLFAACTNTDQKETSKPKIEPKKNEPSVMAIENSDFSITCQSDGSTDSNGVPKATLLLASSKINPSVPIATEPSCTEIRNTKAFNIPERTAFATSSYYAGGGNYYYGQVTNDTLNIYRQYIEETHPNNEVNPAETKYELFKMVIILDNGTISVISNVNK